MCALFVLDWHSPAIDERRYDDRIGVLKTECGHTLMRVVTLYEVPNGPPCEASAGKQFEVAQAALDRAATRLRIVPRRHR